MAHELTPDQMNRVRKAIRDSMMPGVDAATAVVWELVGEELWEQAVTNAAHGGPKIDTSKLVLDAEQWDIIRQQVIEQGERIGPPIIGPQTSHEGQWDLYAPPRQLMGV